MRATVIVTLKPTVLDPQGITIHRNVTSLGFAGLEGVRQGKYFEIDVSDDLGEEERRALVERLAREVLANPVVESYRIVWDSREAIRS